MFRNMLKTILCLALALLLAALPAAAETGVEERLSDLETMRAGLEEGHYDLFALVTSEEWEARVEAAAETLHEYAIFDTIQRAYDKFIKKSE